MKKKNVFPRIFFFDLFFSNLLLQLILFFVESIPDRVIASLVLSLLLLPATYLFAQIYEKLDFSLFELLYCIVSAIIIGSLLGIFITTTLIYFNHGQGQDTLWDIVKFILIGNFFFIPIWVFCGVVNFAFIKLIQKPNKCTKLLVSFRNYLKRGQKS